jgi:hypothetical protein
MGDSFFNWAEVYFEPESGRRDVFIPREEAFNDFIKSNNIKNYSAQQFVKSMHAWCDYKSFVFNPEVLKNKDKRIIRKTHKKDYNGKILTVSTQQLDGSFKDVPREKVSTEMIYVQTENEIDLEAIKKRDQMETQQINGMVGGASVLNFGDEDGIPD